MPAFIGFEIASEISFASAVCSWIDDIVASTLSIVLHILRSAQLAPAPR